MCWFCCRRGAIAGHVGDSRIYRLRDHTIGQLTFDHSLQWELRASGQLPEGADISAVVPKNVITRSLGPNPTVQIDLEGPHPIAAGDVYLLCSDGLTGRVEDQELGAILASLPPNEAAHALVDLANLRGGPDNVTVLIAKVTGSEFQPEPATSTPLRMGASSSLQPLHIVLLIIAVACGLVAGLMAIVSHLLAAGIALGLGLVFAAIALLHRQIVLSGTRLGGSRMLGKGPYTTRAVNPISNLFAVWTPRWRSFGRPLAKEIGKLTGSRSTNPRSSPVPQRAAGNFAEAVRQYCRAISHMMSELRHQQKKKLGSTTINFDFRGVQETE